MERCMSRIPKIFALFAALTLFAAACGDDDSVGSSDAPTIVVTTNILGDVVENLTGGVVEVITIMPVGADPHDFQASAQQVNAMRSAEALIVNGLNFEEGLLDVIDAAEADGVPVYEAVSAVSTIEFGAKGHGDHEGHDDHDDEGHDDHDDEGHDDHDDEGHDDHGHSGDDPHFFTDPARMAEAVHGIAEFLIANVDGIDASALEEAAEMYEGELKALDTEVANLVDSIPESNRVLITNHAVFGYFADRYGLEVAGAIIQSGSTLDGTSAGELAELAALIEMEGVLAIFSDTSASDAVAQALADEVGEVAVVALFTESLGDADSEGATYVDMVRTNAQRIADALAS